MHRRTVITGASGVGFVALSGCLGLFTDDCPDPDIDHAMSHESYPHRVTGGFVPESFPAIRLATDVNEVDQFDGIDPDPRTWADETDFDASVVVGIQHVSPSDATPLRILGVDRETGGAVRVYTCIEDDGQHLDAVTYTNLIRVRHGGSVPTIAHLSFWDPDDGWKSYSSE